MKKLLSFLLIILSIFSYSQDYYIEEINFLDTETKNKLGTRITVEVYDETKVILNLKRPNLKTNYYFASSRWEITPISYNSITISDTFGSFNTDNPKLSEENIIFTIKNDGDFGTTKQYRFTLKNTSSKYLKVTKDTELIINVVQLNPCDKKIVYEKQNFNRNKINIDATILFNNGSIKSSEIAAYRSIIRNSKIYTNSKIYAKHCFVNKEILDIPNSLYNNSSPPNSLIYLKNTFTISPNPTSSQVQINSTVGINEWFVYDINAKVVLAGNNKNTNTLKVNLQSLAAGLYYFKFTDTTGTLHEKTIIKK